MSSANDKQVKEWLQEGVAKGATHVLLGYDLITQEEQPIYLMLGDDFYAKLNKKGFRVQRVFDLKLDFKEQLDDPRAWNGPPRRPLRMAQ